MLLLLLPLLLWLLPLQAIAAPLGALVLKSLPARQLEAMVSVLMVLIMGLMNRRALKDWVLAAVRWLEPSQAAYTGHRPVRQGKKGSRLPRGSAGAGSASSLSGWVQLRRRTGAGGGLNHPETGPEELGQTRDTLCRVLV